MAIDRRDKLTYAMPEYFLEEPVKRFEPAQVRGATLAAKLCRAMVVALEDCGETREEIAWRMSDYLGEKVSKAMLDAYVSEARADHNINLVRYAALIHATHDWRLLSLMTELFGFAAVEDRYVHLIKAAQKREMVKELLKSAEIDEHLAQRGGR